MRAEDPRGGWSFVRWGSKVHLLQSLPRGGNGVSPGFQTGRLGDGSWEIQDAEEDARGGRGTPAAPSQDWGPAPPGTVMPPALQGLPSRRSSLRSSPPSPVVVTPAGSGLAHSRFCACARGWKDEERDARAVLGRVQLLLKPPPSHQSINNPNFTSPFTVHLSWQEIRGHSLSPAEFPGRGTQ